MPRGLILAGIPGTGKTVLVKAIAYELGIPLAILDASAFLRGVVGETESRVKQIIAILESLAPIVVFWDELDAVFQPRESQLSTDSGVSRRMLNALLEYLGRTDRKAFVIGATNFPQLDKAATRPGRFDNMFGIFPPDYEARKEVLSIHMNVIRKLPINEETQKKIQETIASETFGYTPAELEQIVKNACSIAMDEDKGKITLEHFRAAKESLGVNIQTRIQEVETMAKQLSTIPNVNMGFLKESLIEFGSGKDKDKTKTIIATLPDDLRGSLKAL
ncbi:Proteasome-activating nucleotidase [uncultured archaeon]|nr:Proteasome-activating nucleotidase [uncultured archaeon]